MLKIISNGSKWAGEAPDSIDELCSMLQRYSLNPTFEEFGNFVDRDPKWVGHAAETYCGCTHISGNFRNYSHVFSIITDDVKIIDRLEKLIRTNQAMPEYQADKNRIRFKGR